MEGRLVERDAHGVTDAERREARHARAERELTERDGDQRLDAVGFDHTHGGLHVARAEGDVLGSDAHADVLGEHRRGEREREGARDQLPVTHGGGEDVHPRRPHEDADELRRRALVELARGRHLEELAVAQDGDPVGEGHRLDVVVGDVQNRRAERADEGRELAADGWPLTPAKIKNGLESLRSFDANGFIAPVTVTAKDHGGGGKTRIDMWDGSKWVPQSDWVAAYTDVVDQVVKEQSAEFAKSGK